MIRVGDLVRAAKSTQISSNFSGIRPGIGIVVSIFGGDNSRWFVDVLWCSGLKSTVLVCWLENINSIS